MYKGNSWKIDWQSNIDFTTWALDPSFQQIALQKQLIERGKAYINYTQVKGVTVFRLNVINPDVEKEDIDKLLDYVIELGQEQERDQAKS